MSKMWKIFVGLMCVMRDIRTLKYLWNGFFRLRIGMCPSRSTYCTLMYTEGKCQSFQAQSWGEFDCINIDVLKVQNCLFKQLAHSSDTNRHNTRRATRGLFTVPRSRIEPWLHGTLPPQVTQASNKTSFKKRTKKIPCCTKGTVKRHCHLIYLVL